MESRENHEQPPHATRVLHVVESFDGQATESWLLRVHNHVRREGIDQTWTFYCTLPGRGRFDDLVSASGARVIHSPHPLSQTTHFVGALRAELERGAYDVVHAHHDVLSGLYLWAARRLRIRRRIVHAHNALQKLPAGEVKRAIFTPLMRAYCLATADRIVGVSGEALTRFLAASRRRPSRDRVIHCGIEPSSYRFDAERAHAYRRALGIPDEVLMLLFVGRLVPYKNPMFALGVFENLRRANVPAAVVFVGTGLLEADLRARASAANSGVHVLGWRSDVAALMNAADVMLWPSEENPKEGLGLGVVEAQAAGLPTIISLGVPDEAIVSADLVRRVPLSQGSEAWARAAVDLTRSKREPRQRYADVVARSSFDLAASAEAILQLY